MAVPLLRRLESTRSYGLLLGLIVFTLTFMISAPDRRWTRLFDVVLQGGTLLLALWTTRTPERDFRWALAAVGLALAIGIGVGFSDDPRVYKGGLLAIGALEVLVVPVVVAHGVFHGIRENGVTMQAAFGVLCVYLLIGMLFGFGYGLVAVLQGGALFANGTDGDLQSHMYFSFITITTVGYGDLAPAGNLARALSILEALVGQLYLVTVVAVIVGNLGRPRSS